LGQIFSLRLFPKFDLKNFYQAMMVKVMIVYKKSRKYNTYLKALKWPYLSLSVNFSQK
jgi:hypothetical protein